MNISQLRRKLFCRPNRPCANQAARLDFLMLEDRVVPANLFDTLKLGGINAEGLGLTGSGVRIGQIEGNRPGKPGFDVMPANVTDAINPTRVWWTDQGATKDNANEITAQGDTQRRSRAS